MSKWKDKYQKWERKFRTKRDKVLGSEVGGALSDGVRVVAKQKIAQKGGLKGVVQKHGKKGMVGAIAAAAALYYVDPILATSILASLFS